MNLSKLQETVKDRKAWLAAVYELSNIPLCEYNTLGLPIHVGRYLVWFQFFFFNMMTRATVNIHICLFVD